MEEARRRSEEGWESDDESPHADENNGFVGNDDDDEWTESDESGGYREPVFERDGRSRTKDENDARLHVVLVEGGWNEHVRVYAGMENKSRVRELDEHAGETSVALSSRSVPVFAER